MPRGKRWLSIFYASAYYLYMVYWLFIISLIIQCIYALGIFSRFFSLWSSKSAVTATQQPVSVIICAKNEGANLKKYLPYILTQKYSDKYGCPLFEVIVADDGSTDDTAAILAEFKTKYSHLKTVFIEPQSTRILPGKKAAMSAGVSMASYKLLLLTDADCVPSSGRWLQLMTEHLNEEQQIVAGYGGYNATNSLLNTFIRWETVHTFLQYSTYTLLGYPYMAVGRNMACTKAVMNKAMADKKWVALPSGDDDLLVTISANNHNMAIVCDGDAYTRTDAKDKWKAWVHQKQRHLSTGKYYKLPVQILLSVYAISHAITWITFFVTLSSHFDTVACLMAARCLIYWCLWGAAASKLGEKRLIYFFPFLDIAWMVYNFAFFPFITWKNKKQWK